MYFNQEKIVTTAFVTFKKKEHTYKKKLYFIMTKRMKENLKYNNINKNQFFIDITHYVIPRNNDCFKFYVIFSF